MTTWKKGPPLSFGKKEGGTWGGEELSWGGLRVEAPGSRMGQHKKKKKNKKRNNLLRLGKGKKKASGKKRDSRRDKKRAEA